MTGVCWDITESKLAECLLRRAKEQWERTFNSVPDLITILDNQHRVLRVNESLARRLGLKKEECVGLYCYEAIHGTSVPPAFCPHSRTMKDGCEHTEEQHIERFAGDFQVTTTSRECIGSVHIAHDISERKNMEDALKKFNEELEERVVQRTEELRQKDEMLLLQSRQAALGEMIGNIAHQWRQPLNILGLGVQSLLMIHDLGELTREYLENSVNNSMAVIQHMSRTIDDFRNFFRPDKESTEFRVSDVISTTLSLIEESFKNENIRIDVRAKNNPGISGYKNEYAQVILNILNNARDVLMERQIEDPKVTFTIGSEDGRAVVTIADNAGGIPEEIIGKIFDPYFTTKGPQVGTGVGLYMSKTIIEKNMNGRLTARNTTDGAEFRIEV
jgi:PAS domain S-box-containing protein